MSRSCHTARLGSLRVEPDDRRVGRDRLPLGDGVGRGVRDGVGRRIRSCDVSLFRRWDLAGYQQQAAQEERGGRRAGCHGFDHVGPLAPRSGCCLGRKPVGRHADGQSGRPSRNRLCLCP